MRGSHQPPLPTEIGIGSDRTHHNAQHEDRRPATSRRLRGRAGQVIPRL